MPRALQIFVGLPVVLRPFLGLAATARLYGLARDADLAVLLFEVELQDALHRRFGTGDWPEGQGAILSTTDQSFAAECAQAAPLAYLERIETAEAHLQSAAVWQLGRLTIGPTTLDLSGPGAQRARALWPMNVALRMLGVRTSGAIDECAAFGLDAFPDNATIHARAWPRRL